MSDWLHNLPVPWMALVVFGFTYLLAAAVYAAIATLAVGERAKSFKAISPGMLPVLGIIFGLFIAEETAAVEWPLMARQTASLKTTPRPLAEALQLVLSLTTAAPGQQTAQHEITSAIETALDARRQRIIISRSEVNFVKWSCLYLQAVCALLAIALVHCDDRLASAVAMGLFATGVAASVLLIAAHDRPFTGQISVTPESLLQIMPDAPTK